MRPYFVSNAALTNIVWSPLTQQPIPREICSRLIFFFCSPRSVLHRSAIMFHRLKFVIVSHSTPA